MRWKWKAAARIGRLRAIAWCCGVLTVVAVLAACGGQTGEGKTIVLIGGQGSEGPGKHAYGEGLQRLRAQLAAQPQLRQARIQVFADGWPQDPAALENASTVVLYFDGGNKQPLLDAGHRQQLAAAMARGTGLVALHQAFTVPAVGNAALPLRDWLGGERVGLFDRSTETTTVQVAQPAHPVLHGVQPFTYRDEFYPTVRMAAGAVPLLRADLHPQFRDGKPLLDNRTETTTVGWAFERADGGRAFGYSGAHFLTALEEPMLARTLINAVLWSAHIDVPDDGAKVPARSPASGKAITTQVQTSPLDVPTFHMDRTRSGWHRHQPALAPAKVAANDFGLLWESPALDSYQGQAPRLYASPLYLHRLRLSDGPQRGETFSVVIAASNHGDVYAINAAKAGDLAPGRILWKTKLGTPCHLQPAPLDGVPTGILSTPVIDAARGRLYVTHCDEKQRWQAYALDLGSGRLLPGWPVRLDEARMNQLNRNAGPQAVAPKRKFDFRVQRGALNLNADGTRLYIGFGETETGWLVAVDTQQPRMASAFAAVAMPHRGSGGIWGAGGAAVDGDGQIYVVTGSGFDGYKPQSHDWTQSLLQLSDSAEGLTLRGTYTPFNHCSSAKMDIDLGSGGVSLLPALPAGSTRTPQLLAIGGKQGNAYLLDRQHLPGRLDTRPACDTPSARDGSLLPPNPQPQFGARGPLNVFGPYSEQDAALDQARARSLPAAFVDAAGQLRVYLTGNTKRAPGSPQSKPPSVARLRVDARAGQDAYLAIERLQPDLVLGNPGPPVISSDGGQQAVVWVLDENAPRSAALSGPDAPAPVLYALDADSLKLLWRSAPGQLYTSGKYNEPVFADGRVVVGTDRIQVFGSGAAPQSKPTPRIANESPAPAAPVAVAADSGLDGATLFQQRCAMCHDHPVGNVPPRSYIATRPREAIVHALSSGVMKAQASGLSAHDIELLADHLRAGANAKP